MVENEPINSESLLGEKIAGQIRTPITTILSNKSMTLMFAKNCLPLLYTMRQYPTRNQPYLRAYYQTKKATNRSKIWHLCRPHSARSSMGWCSETGTPMVLECTMDIHKFLPDRAILASKWAYRYQEEYCLSVSLINRRPLGGWNDLPCSEKQPFNCEWRPGFTYKW